MFVYQFVIVGRRCDCVTVSDDDDDDNVAMLKRVDVLSCFLTIVQIA